MKALALLWIFYSILITRVLSQSVICQNNNGSIIVKEVFRKDDQMIVWTNWIKDKEETSYIISGYSWDGNRMHMKSLKENRRSDSNFLSWAVNYPGIGKRLIFVDYQKVLFNKLIKFANYFGTNRWTM